eukprot:TRINITY_DN6142_c0_g4_i1.p1 TRINITY_DN6142_c0_g4~~TRINITY_DN6142_c0_g4_i1.p1  ORF type:complete len:566 (+),score=124.05 TRINITY_DN6142_c0_g4_i1:81-1778(+)
MAAHAFTAFAAALCLLVGRAHGNAFRGNLRSGGHSDLTIEQVRATVLEEVTAALGSGNRVTEKRLAAIEKVLEPTFAAMPKNEHGNLDDAAARYVLHRLFVQRHAMYIKGLEPAGQVWNSTSTVEVLDDHIPSFVLSLFEERLKGQGLSLHETAVLAATLEHLIHDEAVQRLTVVYEANNISKDARVQEFTLEALLESYMMFLVLGKKGITADSLAQQRAKIADSYPGWSDTRKFAFQVSSSIIGTNSADPDFAPGNLSFRAATDIVEEIGEKYGRWQNSECLDLKEMLVKMEHGSSGRVLLKDFYGSALKGNWQFSERVDYLREMGALDKTDEQHLSVLIANYVNSPSNCVASSSIYSVCCINECEALMASLERQVASPETSVDRILEIVSQLPSATVAAPRELPAELRSRLEEVAAHHGGQVPLHGRLFGQWLHHAFPRECPYPHTSGETAPMSADQWMLEKGVAVTATAHEMRQILADKPEATAAPEARLPWTTDEALITSHRQKTTSASRSWIRSVVLLAAAGSFSIAMFRMVSDTFSGAGKGKRGDGSLLPHFSAKQHAC